MQRSNKTTQQQDNLNSPTPMELLNQNVKINGVKSGLLLGLVVILLSVFSFYFVTGLGKSYVLFIAGPIIFRILVPIAIVLLLCFRMRNNVGGYWTFKQATTGIFIMFFTAYLLNLIGMSVVFPIVEPNYVAKTQASVVKMTTAMMNEKKVDPAKQAAAISDLKKEMNQKQNVTIWSTVMDNAIVIVFLFVFSLLFASLLRNAEYVSATQGKG